METKHSTNHVPSLSSISLTKKETRMEKQNEAVSSSIPPNQEKSEKPAAMASQEETTPRCRPGGGDDVEAEADASVKPEDFEFCILAPGGLVEDAAGVVDMCVAGEVFSGGKLVPFRLSSATSADALLLLRSDSLDSSSTETAASTSDFSSSSDSGSASFSSSSSGLSRSASLKSASSSSDSAAFVGLSHSPAPQNGPACAPPGRSLTSSSWFYAHPSPSPRPPPPRRTGGSAVSAARRSTGSAPPPAAAWGVIRLGVVGAPELVYPPYGAEARKVARSRGGVSRSVRLDQPRPAGNKEQPLAADKKKKLVFGLLGAGLACSCSADDVAPRQAAVRRRQRRKAEQTKKGEVDSGDGAVLGSSSGRRSSSQLPNAKSKNSVNR